MRFSQNHCQHVLPTYLPPNPCPKDVLCCPSFHFRKYLNIRRNACIVALEILSKLLCVCGGVEEEGVRKGPCRWPGMDCLPVTTAWHHFRHLEMETGDWLNDWQTEIQNESCKVTRKGLKSLFSYLLNHFSTLAFSYIDEHLSFFWLLKIVTCSVLVIIYIHTYIQCQKNEHTF